MSEERSRNLRWRQIGVASTKLPEDVAFQKQAIVQDGQRDRTSTSRFIAPSESVEDALKHHTVGLVHLDDFRDKRQALEDAANAKVKDKDADARKKKRDKKKAVLSFDGEDEAAVSSEPPHKRSKVGKDPSASTSFLPDQQREAEERETIAQLEAQFYAEHERRKLDLVTIVYAHWDGTGHRAQVDIKKGDSIGAFLEKTRQKSPQLRGINVDNLMYVVDDLIIPHHHTFYELAISRKRGRTGLLFDFDPPDDVREAGDFRVEKDESRAGKVVQRSFYQKQRHVYPQNRWELFNPDTDCGFLPIVGLTPADTKKKDPLPDTRHTV